MKSHSQKQDYVLLNSVISLVRRGNIKILIKRCEQASTSLQQHYCHLSAMQMTGLYHPVRALVRYMGVCHRVKCLLHKWKRKRRLAHLWPQHCLMVALPLYTLVILRLSPHKDDGAPLNVRWVLRVQTRRSSPQQAGDRKLRNQAPRKPTPSYISNHLNPNSNGFLVSSALYRLCRTNLSVGGGGEQWVTILCVHRVHV